MVTNDLHVTPISDSLKDSHIDLVISGSIGAVESVRFIRSMRRLGANIYPYLTKGAQLFTTPTAVSWAAAREVNQMFDGTASHLAQRDACIVAPASASFLSKVAQGITDSPGTALVASYLGQGKPVFFVPNMHDSLLLSPFVASNIERLKAFTHFLEPRVEEGKQKFPDPATLADRISHSLNSQNIQFKILITMGTTRGYIDTVRYISNYSSGALGSKLAEEFYRHGFFTKVIAGPCPIRPRVSSECLSVETHEQMSEAVIDSNKQKISGAIFAASVLDFTPSHRVDRKIRSTEHLEVSFTKTSKIIAMLDQPLAFKVGFKLESEINQESAQLADLYRKKYNLSHLIMNQLAEVSDVTHKAYAYSSMVSEPLELHSKARISQYLVHEASKTLR